MIIFIVRSAWSWAGSEYSSLVWTKQNILLKFWFGSGWVILLCKNGLIQCQHILIIFCSVVRFGLLIIHGTIWLFLNNEFYYLFKDCTVKIIILHSTYQMLNTNKNHGILSLYRVVIKNILFKYFWVIC